MGMIAKNNKFYSGPRGKSAYEVAVKNGFEGTEQEWLESLKATSEGSGDDNVIESISLNGTKVAPDVNKNVNIEIPIFDGDAETLDGHNSEYFAKADDLVNYLSVGEITNSIDETSTNEKVPGAKAVHDSIVNAMPSVMTGATSSAAGTEGLVPAPSKSSVLRHLCSDGTWQKPAAMNLNDITIAAKTSATLTPNDFEIFEIKGAPGCSLVYMAIYTAQGAYYKQIAELCKDSDKTEFLNVTLTLASVSGPPTIQITNNNPSYQVTIHRHVLKRY